MAATSRTLRLGFKVRTEWESLATLSVLAHGIGAVRTLLNSAAITTARNAIVRSGRERKYVPVQKTRSPFTDLCYLIDIGFAEVYRKPRIRILQPASFRSKTLSIGANWSSQFPGRHHELPHAVPFQDWVLPTVRESRSLEQRICSANINPGRSRCVSNGFPVKIAPC